MLKFRCSYQWGPEEQEEWEGAIQHHKDYGRFHEIFIVSPTSCLRVIVGMCSTGLFACIPDERAGCHLNTIGDCSYNSVQLGYALGDVIDGMTVACALELMAGHLKFQ